MPVPNDLGGNLGSGQVGLNVGKDATTRAVGQQQSLNSRSRCFRCLHDTLAGCSLGLFGPWEAQCRVSFQPLPGHHEHLGSTWDAAGAIGGGSGGRPPLRGTPPPAACLSKAHIRARGEETLDNSGESGMVQVLRSGAVLRCEGIGKRVVGVGDRRKGGGKRGKVSEFSTASGRRLRRMLLQLPHEVVDGGMGVGCFFVTLTYHDRWPGGQAVKVHLAEFVRRLGRCVEHERFFVFWRLEPQKRGAPHLHLLVVGELVRPDDFDVTHAGMSWLQQWVADTWNAIAAPGDDAHWRVTAHRDTVQQVVSYSRLIGYLGKYLSKEDEAKLGDYWENAGRRWGLVNRAYFRTLCRVLVYSIPYRKYVWMLRTLRRRIRSKSFRRFVSGRSNDRLWLFDGVRDVRGVAAGQWLKWGGKATVFDRICTWLGIDVAKAEVVPGIIES